MSLNDALLLASREVLLAVDPASLQVVACNPYAESFLGQVPGGLLGMSINDIEASLSDVFYWEGVRQGLVESVDAVESLYRHASGDLLAVRKSVLPVDHDGRSLVLIRAVDSRAEKRVEEALARSSAELRTTLEATADGILALDADGHVVNFNRRFAQLWALPESAVLQRDDTAVFAWIESCMRDPAAYLERLEVLRGDPEAEYFDVLELADGRVFERTCRPQYLGDSLVGRVFSFTDVTARARAEEALMAARDQAEAANRAKSDFLAMMSHEIRTPMNGVLGMIDVLATTSLSDEQQGFVETIRRSAGSLLSIIDDILDLSKIEAQRLELERVSFDLHKLVQDTVLLFGPRAREKNIALVSHIAPEVPCGVRGDPTRLRQVLNNLVSNAIKFTREGEVGIELEAVNDAPGESLHLQFVVRDTGIGIPADKLEAIFEPFVQADGSTTRKFGGTGLGLAICRRIVRLMGGEIRAEQGEPGSRFVFDVTLLTDTAVTASTSAASVNTSSALPSISAVLVAEDNEVNVQVLRLLLNRLGIGAVRYVSDGREALQALESGRFDLVLMDCLMPEVDGYEAARRLRERGDQTWVIAMTANAMAGDREACLAAGMDDYVAKPLSLASLREALLRWNGRRHAEPPGKRD